MSARDPLSVVDDLPPEHLALLRGVLCGFDSRRIATLVGVGMGVGTGFVETQPAATIDSTSRAATRAGPLGMRQPPVLGRQEERSPDRRIGSSVPHKLAHGVGRMTACQRVPSLAEPW